MNVESPFTLIRSEYEAKHLYFLPKDVFRRIEQRKPIYLVGSRGTGKTTLLKSLDWRERKDNESLQSQLDPDTRHNQYLGIYLKLPEFRFGALRDWLADESRLLYASLFAFYLDLIWLQGLMEAISELLAVDILTAPATSEHECVKTVVNAFPNLFTTTSQQLPLTLRDLRNALRDIRVVIEGQALIRGSATSLVSRFKVGGQVGIFGKEVAQLLQPLCRPSHSVDIETANFHFKICMDEGECLDDFQRVVINTMVRLARTPVFFVISFVSLPRDIATTLEHSLTLQAADRELILLDNMTERDFREFAEGVASIRVKDRLKDLKARFDSRVTFGELDVNSLLLEILTESVSPKAKRLLEDARAFAGKPHSPAVGTRRRKRGTPDDSPESPRLPIYEAYLTQRLNISLPSPDDPKWSRRKQDSAEMRKRIGAAYLSICGEVGADVRYASADMVLQMSDRCVRDFLHQVDSVFRASRKSVRAFVESLVTTRVQDIGLQEASKEKFQSIPNSGVNSPTQTGKVLRGLGEITARIQSTSEGYRHLKSSERGIFFLDIRESTRFQGAHAIMQTIREAAEAGFLRIKRDDEHTLAFRVHKSLAAAYGFSYRGAYYPVRLKWDDLMKLAKARDETEVDNIAAEISTSVDRLPTETLPLFGESDDGSSLNLS